MTNVDAYRDIAELYLSLVTPQTVRSGDLNDPVMSKWIAENVPNGAKILDAGCGLGFQTVVLHKGSLGENTSKRFRAYACDYSQAMLDAAVSNGAKAGLERNRYRRSSFAQLGNAEDGWEDFDAVLVSYGIYTFPDDVAIENYDDYFVECCRGLAAVIKPDGHLIFNVRDWNELAKSGKNQLLYENKHGETTYRCNYSWTLNDNGHHTAILAMSNSDGEEQTTTINYAQRTPEEHVELARRCGLVPVFMGHHGEDLTAYHVIVMKKTA